MEYQEKLRTYIEDAFQGLPDTEELRGTRDELSADLLDRYAQALSDGEAPEQAYHTALGSLGDLSELVETLGGKPHPAAQECEPAPQTREAPRHEPGHPRPPEPPHHEPGHPRQTSEISPPRCNG